MPRFGNSEECAELIAFFASDSARFIPGSEISISG
ncbi:MAG: short-chain dehydrogenase, partial [Lentisphaeria bacterium]|nr:short-chain dehydrogenase [Lentisphaeria bacterium]